MGTSEGSRPGANEADTPRSFNVQDRVTGSAVVCPYARTSMRQTPAMLTQLAPRRGLPHPPEVAGGVAHRLDTFEVLPSPRQGFSRSVRADIGTVRGDQSPTQPRFHLYAESAETLCSIVVHAHRGILSAGDRGNVFHDCSDLSDRGSCHIEMGEDLH